MAQILIGQLPDIPEMLIPSIGSTIAFVAVIAFVAGAFVVGVWRGGESEANRSRWLKLAMVGIIGWMLIGAVLPMSGVLSTKMMPPPALIFALFCFVTATIVAFSKLGSRLVALPFAALVGFHVFRLPLELVLHQWYLQGSLPIQMTFEGHNFDIVTGVLALVVGCWAHFGNPPRVWYWIFNLVGIALLITVVLIAVFSIPVPFRQYMNDPPVLLPFNFPYSWIVSVAVTGALLGHLVLFRKMLQKISQ